MPPPLHPGDALSASGVNPSAGAITAFVYPVVAYWGWNGDGFLKKAGGLDDTSKGYMVGTPRCTRVLQCAVPSRGT